jgi:hypothetical protein
VDTVAALAELLRSRGADGIEHPSGTLGAHLARVQHRLASLGAGPVLQLAARAHAVYGTDGFDVRLLGLDERPLLADVIGADAEELVHRYGGCDRARTWGQLATRHGVRSRFTGDFEELGPEALRDFADLSLVSEMDVAEHAPGFLDRHGDYFRRLTGAWFPILSRAVAADAARVFG